MKHFYTLFVCLLPLLTVAQVRNNQWVFGYDEDIPNQFGMSSLEFVYPDIFLSVYGYQNEPSWVGVGSSFVCDRNGKIALISDNCSIYDHTFGVIEGGENMHGNSFSQGYCKTNSKIFGLWQTNILFPSSSESNTYYQLYQDLHMVDSLLGLASLNLMFNLIKKNEQGRFYIAKHDTISKNRYQVLYTVTPAYYDRKWYFYNMDNKSNTYHMYSIDESNNKVDTLFSQNIGEPLQRKDQQGTSGIFSPDLKTFSITVSGKGLMIFDFDIRTQLFSNSRFIYLPLYPRYGFSPGMAYSPNSRFVYVSTFGYDAPGGNTNFLYQVDLQSNTSELIATFFEPDEVGWPIGIGSITQGPDCRLYVSPGSTTHFIHTIHHPDRKGAACTFQPLAINVPTLLFSNLPTFVTSGEDCDSTYNWPFKPLGTHDSDLHDPGISLYPNPASEYLFLRSEITSPVDWSVYFYDARGTVVATQHNISAPVTQLRIDLLTAGIYFYKICDTQGKILKSGKIVKI